MKPEQAVDLWLILALIGLMVVVIHLAARISDLSMRIVILEIQNKELTKYIQGKP